MLCREPGPLVPLHADVRPCSRMRPGREPECGRTHSPETGSIEMTTTANTVVFGVDGPPVGDRAVEYASELAERDHLDLRLVHVSYAYRVHSPMWPCLPRAMAREIGESVLQAAAKH